MKIQKLSSNWLYLWGNHHRKIYNQRLISHSTSH